MVFHTVKLLVMNTPEFNMVVYVLPSSVLIISYLFRIAYTYMRREINIIERGKKEYKMLYIPVYGYFLEISR